MNRRSFLGLILAAVSLPGAVAACTRLRKPFLVGELEGASIEKVGLALDDLHRVAAYARANGVKPASIEGEDCYVVMVHPGAAVIVPARSRGPAQAFLPYGHVQLGNRCA